MAKRGQTIRKPPTARKRSSAGRRAPAPKRTEADVDTNTEVVTLKHELAEAREQQAATSELLKVIGRSTFDLQPVFETLAENAGRLCEAKRSFIFRFDGQYLRVVATHNVSAEIKAFVEQNPIAPGRASATARAALEQRTVHVLDAQTDPEYTYGSRLVEPFRTILTVPMLKAGELLGVILVYRLEMRPFTDSQIALLETFADQAVIAIENSRLFNETKEALERQTATADVLNVISRSPTDAAPVFEVIGERAENLCNAEISVVSVLDGDLIKVAGIRGIRRDKVELFRAHFPMPLDRKTVTARTINSGTVVHIADVLADTIYDNKVLAEQTGYRSGLGVPMHHKGQVVGAIFVARTEPGLFSENQVRLLQIFADQAVIAIQNVKMFQEVQARTRDLQESLQQQTATADVLKVISRSTFDLQTVLDALVESATHLCEADHAWLFRRDGDFLRFKSSFGHGTATHEAIRKLFQRRPVPIDRGSITGRSALGACVVHVADVLADPDYTFIEAQEIGGYRAALGAPLLRDGKVAGVIFVAKTRPEPFSTKQIELVTTFADQAVIAIENARLFEEVKAKTEDLTESLQQQTATADVLKIISRSSVDLETVLDTLVETVARLCRADQTAMYRRREDKHHLVAAWGMSEEATQFALAHPLSAGRGTLTGRVILERRAVHMPDVFQDPEYTYSEGQKAIGYRTLLGIPLLREDALLGIFAITRTRVEPFTDKEIELATSFADQAVIAIENARLFDELRQSLQQQTATADVLKVISRSTFDLGSVLQTLVASAAHLCEADKAVITRQAGEVFYRAESYGFSEEFMDHLRKIPIKPERGSASGRVLLEGKPIHILDVQSDPEYALVEEAKWGGYHTGLAVPILRERVPIGVLSLLRSEVQPFTDKQIELVSTFADQAAIAIENARLVAELRERQAELRVTFDNMGDGVAMFDASTRLTAWNRNFQDMLELPDAFLSQRPSFAEYFRYLADSGEYSADLEADLSRANQDPRRELRFERTRPDGRVIEVRRNPVPGGGFVLIYADITERKRAEQAIRAARDAAETTLRDLQAAQVSLVHAQKMAALGQLTAGIAHEIKNPLNFVNNFAALSSELTDELSDVLKPVALPGEVREGIEELTGTLKDNLERVVQHGKRADSIVKNMLLHSREGSGEHRPADINALVDESLNLAYHGARAEKQSFNITLQRDLDPSSGMADVFPQEITRVLLNLISNGFYAAAKRATGMAADGFEPKLKALTRNLGEKVEIRIRDNGTGIPPDIQEKIFNPFFTTKPAGEGTGLGLSLSHDIVVKQHGGTIQVVTEPGSFTEFIITLPRVMQAEAGGQRK